MLGPSRVRFVFKEPWPDFPAFYGTFVTGAGWVVPKRYVERVGEEALPQGARRRRALQVRQLQPRRRADARGLRRLLAEDPLDQAARLPQPCPTRPPARPRSRAARWTSPSCSAAPPGKRSAARRDCGWWRPLLGIFWLDFPDQWDPKSPWADRRVRTR